MSEELIAIGKVLRTVGLDGLCVIEPFGNTFGLLQLPVDVQIGLSENYTRPQIIEEIQERPKGFVCRFKGIDDLQTAEGIREYLIFIHTEQLPSLGTEQFYHFELKGMDVFSDHGQQIGFVEDVHNFPTTDSLEVRRRDGELILIPMNDDSLVSISKESRRVVVRQSFLEELL